MSEYLSFVCDAMNGATGSAHTSGVWKADSRVAKYWPVPLDHPALFDYYTDVYGPGPMVLFRQLEVMTSRAQVLAAIKSVLGSPHALTVDDLLAALSRETGLDLTQSAHGWTKGSGAPHPPQLAPTFPCPAAPPPPPHHHPTPPDRHPPRRPRPRHPLRRQPKNGSTRIAVNDSGFNQAPQPALHMPPLPPHV